MAATAAPYGALPIGSLSGHDWRSKIRLYPIASAYDTSIFYGDFVKLVAAGGVEKDPGTTALTPIGIFVGCQYTNGVTNQWLQAQYWPADTVASDAYAFVVDDPYVLFQMQGNGAIQAADRGQNAAVVQTAGTALVGRSKNSVNATTSATAGYPLRIVDFVDGPLSAAGDAYTDVICKFNAGHQLITALGV